MNTTYCDKCGQAVDPKNSAMRLEDILAGQLRWVYDRHLYPTPDCEGSPSRVRLVEAGGQWGEAYRKLQEGA